MSVVTEKILREGLIDWVSTIRVENLVTDYGVPDLGPVRRAVEAAVRELVESGLAVIGHPLASAPGRFLAWSDDPKVALEKLTQEWDSGRLERAESFAWLNLTPAGEREGERLMAERRRCETRVIEELSRRHPELVAAVGPAEGSDSQSTTLASIAAEVAAGKAPPWRPPLAPDVLRAVTASIDELYGHGDTCTRELILDELVRRYAAPYGAEHNDLLITRLGPRLREVIEKHDDALRTLGTQ